MRNKKKDLNVQVGQRLQDARKRLGYRQADFAAILEVSEEHYRKYELGTVGFPIDKMSVLFEKFGIEPTYLITGRVAEEFDVETYLANCEVQQRNIFIENVWKFTNKLIRTIE
ncbi:MAG: helix-turn-helix transcriptional regulator [Lachnospiraceae bacterium]|nr:helix-turn-helix transcriptional regulator [Lachnospiraceae bacterium]